MVISMPQLLQEKSLATKFQILVEIAASQPYIRQKVIAQKINITTQAVSLYIKEMVSDGWINMDKRANYQVAKEGVNWLLKSLREMQNYFDRVDKVARNVSVCAAIAGCDLSEGQQVGLLMKDGRLIASDNDQHGAKGIAVIGAKEGEDVGISFIEGIVELERGQVIILSIPAIHKGGSHKVDLTRLRREINRPAMVGAIGIESITALERIGITPQYIHGVREAAIEATQCGLDMVVVCVSNEVPLLMHVLDDKHVNYTVSEIEKPE